MWFSTTSQDILHKLNVDLDTGLSKLEAKNRLEKNGETCL